MALAIAVPELLGPGFRWSGPYSSGPAPSCGCRPGPPRGPPSRRPRVNQMGIRRKPACQTSKDPGDRPNRARSASRRSEGPRRGAGGAAG